MSKFFEKLVGLADQGKAVSFKSIDGRRCFFVFGHTQYHGLYSFQADGNRVRTNWKVGPVDNDSIAYEMVRGRTLGKGIAAASRNKNPWIKKNILRAVRLARDEYAKYEGYSAEIIHLAQLLSPDDFAKLMDRHPEDLALIRKFVQKLFWRRIGSRGRERHARGMARAKSFKAYIKSHPMYRGIHPSVLNRAAKLDAESIEFWESMYRHGRKAVMFAGPHSVLRYTNTFTKWEHTAWSFRHPQDRNMLRDLINAGAGEGVDLAEITPYTQVDYVRGQHDRLEEIRRLATEAQRLKWLEKDKEYKAVLDAHPWDPIVIDTIPQVRTLVTAEDYQTEGKEMHHCIYGHYNSTQKLYPFDNNGKQGDLQCLHRYGYSIRMEDGEKASAAFKHNPITGDVHFEQLRGPFNKASNEQVIQVCLDLAEALGMNRKKVEPQIRNGYGDLIW